MEVKMEWSYIWMPLVVLIILLICCYRVTQRLRALWNGLIAHRNWAEGFRNTVVNKMEELHTIEQIGDWPPDGPPQFP
jgi:hypothetical protein